MFCTSYVMFGNLEGHGHILSYLDITSVKHTNCHSRGYKALCTYVKSSLSKFTIKYWELGHNYL